jgi:AAA domain-containing protein
MTVLTPDTATSEKFAGLNIIRRGTDKAGIFMALYGPGGAGKTTVASEIVLHPRGKPALLVSADGSYSSVLHLVDEGLDILFVEKWSQVQAILKEVKQGSKYKSIIWDNISEILRLCVKHHAPSGMPEGPAALKLWGQITAGMMEFTAETRSLSMTHNLNVLSVLWEETEKDELTQVIRSKVLLTPKFGAAYPGMVTMLGRLTVPGDARNDYIRKLSFAPSDRTDSKYRVAPTEAAAKIPVELWLRKESHFIVDFLNAVKDDKPFPTKLYERPTTPTNTPTR